MNERLTTQDIIRHLEEDFPRYLREHPEITKPIEDWQKRFLQPLIKLTVTRISNCLIEGAFVLEHKNDFYKGELGRPYESKKE